MHEYLFKIKKGDIEIELKTDNISFFEQQVNNWNDKLLNIKYEETPQSSQIQELTENTDENSVSENFTHITQDETQQIHLEQEEIERETQRILNEFKAEMKEEEIHKEEYNREMQEIIEETVDEHPEEIENSSEEIVSDTNFDAILEESMSQCINNIQENRDENFINLINEKNITEKIDFLITTAYYLEKNQNYSTFTLNQINKKLTENSFESIEYSVMQDAVDNGFAEVVTTEGATETEYKLTEVYKNFVAERAQNV